VQVCWLEICISRRPKVIRAHVDELDIVLVQELLLILCCFLYWLKRSEWILCLLLCCMLILLLATCRRIMGIFILDGSVVFADRTCYRHPTLTQALFRLPHNVLHNRDVELLVKAFCMLLFFILWSVVIVHSGQKFLDESVYSMSPYVLIPESGYFCHEFHFTELLCLYVSQSSSSLGDFFRTPNLQFVELSMLFKPTRYQSEWCWWDTYGNGHD
jgi:hypothetical protein